MHKLAREVLEFPTETIAVKMRVRGVPTFCRVGGEISADEGNLVPVLATIKKFCKRFPETAVVTGSPNARDDHASLVRYKVNNEDCPYLSSKVLDCDSAAVFNGINCLTGVKPTKTAMKWVTGACVHPQSLQQAALVMRSMKLYLNF